MAVPFAALIEPLAEAVVPQVQAACHGLPEGLVVPIARGAARMAVPRLGMLAAMPLHAAFATRRPPPPPLSEWLSVTPASAPHAAHDAFVAEVARMGIAAACPDHPHLGPALAEATQNIVASACELVRHLHGALPRLARRWGDGTALDLAAVRFGLGDPHAGGRTVARLDFADGRALAYKPRALHPERVFHRLQRWLARQPGGERHRIPWTMTEADHGFMEWVQPAPCRDRAVAARLFRRAGSLLALLRVVAGGDIHGENLIACGEYPVAVDLECLVQPGMGDRPPADDPTAPPLFASGLLPVFASRDGGVSFEDMGGLAPAAPRSMRNLGWVHPGTDWQRPAQVEVPLPDYGILPLEETGAPPHLADFVEPFVEGYAATLETLRRGREQLLAPRGVFAALARIQARLLLAPTQAYARVLELRVEAGGAGGSAAETRLRDRRPLLPLPAWTRALEEEAASLARIDVPSFTFRPGGVLAFGPGGPLGAAFAEPPLAPVSRALAALGPQDVRREALLLHRVFAQPADPRPAPDTPREVLRRLAGRLAEAAVEHPDGTVDWVRVGMDIPFMPRPAEPGLGYGVTGIALALAGAARALGDGALEALARRALLRLRRIIASGHGAALAEHFGAGHGRGLGGMLVGLVEGAQLLDDPGMLLAARDLAEAAAHIALRSAGHEADLHDGASGLLLGLEALRRTCPAPCLLPAQRACAEVIEAACARAGQGAPLLAGLSHGASGMAVAAASLRLTSGEARWGHLAARLLRHEATLFDVEAGNWRDLRPRTAARAPWMASWCHGAPGIALARHALLRAPVPELQDLSLDRELAVARETTAARLLQDLDDLCCGDAGRMSILTALGDARAAGAEAEARIMAWGTGGMRLWSDHLKGMATDPSLLKGLAGLVVALTSRLGKGVVPAILLPGCAAERADMLES